MCSYRSSHRVSSLLAVVLFLAACGRAPAGQEESSRPPADGANITVSGAFALFPMMTVWADAYQELHPEVNFDIGAGGAGKGMTDMLSGVADVAMLSREARQEELDQGAFLVPVTIDAVVSTINSGNPYLEQILQTGITSESGASIWLTGETKTWGQLLGSEASEAINAYTRSDSAGAAEMWARFLGGSAQEELKGTAVNGDPGLAEAVRQDPLGIGFNNIGFSYDPTTLKPIDGLQIVPIDLNGDGQIDDEERIYDTRDELTEAIKNGVFPSPPARELYLVTKGEPSPAVAAFLRWVLTDGQAYVADAGYVSLTDERIAEALDSLP